jgi:signal transduction histidine kinase
MQQLEQATGLGGTEHKRVEAVVETLATLHSHGESLVEVAHDARNMVTALCLYCDLLEEPGVLTPSYLHYGNELRLVAAASRRLVEKLVSLDAREAPGTSATIAAVHEPAPRPTGNRSGDRQERARHWDLLPAEPIANLAEELLANRNLLSALAGPAIALTVDAESGALPVRLTGEDLTRVMVNLVKNSTEAMPKGGRIQIGLRERSAGQGAAPWLQLTIEDNGPGIPAETLDKIFDSGYTTRAAGTQASSGWQPAHRGLGLSITRSIVEAAGGRIHAANRSSSGVRFEIELPLRTL